MPISIDGAVLSPLSRPRQTARGFCCVRPCGNVTNARTCVMCRFWNGVFWYTTRSRNPFTKYYPKILTLTTPGTVEQTRVRVWGHVCDCGTVETLMVRRTRDAHFPYETRILILSRIKRFFLFYFFLNVYL